MKESIEFVPNQERQKKIEELIAGGYGYRCLKCNRIYKTSRREHYEDGHGGRYIDMCCCGCDLFQKLEEVSCLDVEVQEPVNGVLVFKEHHAKYCKCNVGEIWTGDSDTECWASFELLRDDDTEKTLKCSKSGLRIVLLKSTEEEMKNPDEVGSKFLRIPTAE